MISNYIKIIFKKEVKSSRNYSSSECLFERFYWRRKIKTHRFYKSITKLKNRFPYISEYT